MSQSTVNKADEADEADKAARATMAEMQPAAHGKAPEMPWGLHLLGDATSKARQGGVVVDIIVVHGLGANPDHAWVRHKDLTAGLERDVRWLTDLLPQTFRDYEPSISARVFCFNYQSAWLGRQLNRNRLENIAGRLLDDIHNARDKNGALPDRPLIFVGHSFGGLVIEQAVVLANSAEGRYQYLVKLIGGVVLLGTPHQGSKSQKWGSIVANLANLIDRGETGLMEEVDEKSMKIFDLISEFKKIMISMDLAKTAVICFYENLPTNYLSRVIKTGPWIQGQTSAMVVEETSAVLSGFSSIVLDSDHLKLNKFSSAQDGNYVSVSSNLCRIAAEAPELFRRRRKETTSSHYLVSRERVKDFIGREGLLEKIRSHFSSDQTGPPPNLILHALGGQGKSQIALEYCRKWRKTYRGVFWINANSETTVTQSYGIIAAELKGVSRIETDDSAAQIQLVKGHLEQWSEAWLLVFDNYDDPERFTEVRQFIPTEGHGHVLFTSRNRDLSRLGTLLEIPPMSTEEGVRLLLRGYSDNEIQQWHKDTASKIINRLGKLALAIDQAASYIKYKRMPLDRLEDFLTTFEAQRCQILSHTPKKFWEYRKMQIQGKAEHISAFTTWEMSFQQLGSGDETWKKDAAHFLTLSAFFAPITITEYIFRCYQEAYDSKTAWIQMFSKTDGIQGEKDDKDEDEMKKNDKEDSQSFGRKFHGLWDPDRFWDTIATAEELSLLQSISPGTGQEGANFSLHPLIRDWLQLRLNTKVRQKYTQETIFVLGCCTKSYKGRSVTLKESTALLTHMDVSMSNDTEFSEPQDRLGCNIENCDTAYKFVDFYTGRGQYRTPEDLCRRTVETERSVLGMKHPFTLKSTIRLALILELGGKHEEAEQVYRQNITLIVSELPEMHSHILRTIASFAARLTDQGKHEEAESLRRQVYTVLGKEHLDTSMGTDDLATILFHEKRYEEAERLYRHTLTVRETLLGKEHPDTLASMSSLAETLRVRDKIEEAEQMYRKTMMLSETLLGKDYPDTLTSMAGLALVLTEQGKYEEAERLYRKTIMLRETLLGKDHPASFMSMGGLALVLTHQGKYEEAERLYRKTIMLRETLLGKDHPDSFMSMDGLALVLTHQGKYEEAERLYRKIIMLRETLLGKDHPDSFMSMDGLTLVLTEQGNCEEPERLYRQTLMLREKLLGKDHPNTLRSMRKLRLVLESQGKYEEAKRISPGKASSSTG